MKVPAASTAIHSYATRVLHIFGSAPAGEVVRWTSPNLSEEEPVALGFADIEVRQLCELFGVLWLWTVVDPDDPLPRDELTVAIEKDRVGGWSPERISRGLEDWTVEGLGRTDIRFHWDPKAPSAIIERVRDAERRSEGKPTIEIGEGVSISPHAFGQLLDLPPHYANRIVSELEVSRRRAPRSEGDRGRH
jgi:hypothetical protein